MPEVIGNVHHLAYAVSRETFERAAKGLEELGYPNTGPIDRGFMDSLYFHDPNGLRIELAVYKFTPPPGRSVADVLARAHQIRIEQGEYAIDERHLAAAVEQLR